MTYIYNFNKLFFTFIFVFSIFFFFGHQYTKLVANTALSTDITARFFPTYKISIDSEKGNKSTNFRVSKIDSNNKIIKSGYVSGSIMVINPIIFFTLLICYPFFSYRDKIKLIIVSMPFLIFSEICCDMFVITYSIEKALQLIGLDNYFKYFLFHFINNGGRQFIGLVLLMFFICIIRNFNQQKAY